jgi:hypothetical protein
MFACMEGHIIIPLGLASMLDVDNTIIPVKLTPLINRIVVMEQDYGEVLSRKLQRTERCSKTHGKRTSKNFMNQEHGKLLATSIENCKAYI